MRIRKIKLLKLANEQCSIILLIKIIGDPLRFVWSEVYKNYDALLDHLANPELGVCLEAHTELGTDFSVEFYGTVGNKVIEAMNGTGVPYKIFKTKLGKAEF